MSGARAGVSLSQLLAEVDRLERELKELGREAQRGGDFVHQLQEIVERDTKWVVDIESNTRRIAQEMLDWVAQFAISSKAVVPVPTLEDSPTPPAFPKERPCVCQVWNCSV